MTRTLAALLLLAAAIGGCRTAEQPPDAPPDVLLPEGGAIDLVAHGGQRFSLADQRGKVVIVFFGYTSCPDYCPAALSRLSRVTDALGAQAADVLTVFISVDPDRDTPEMLGTYVGNFRVNAVGLTGTREAVDDVVRRYGATYEFVDSDSAMGPMVHHSTQFAIVSPSGALVHLLPHDTPVETIVSTVRSLL